MKKSLLVLVILIFSISLFYSCKKEKAEEKEEKVQSLNPNGDSELALLMREMYDEAERIKLAIQKGEEPELNIDYKEILTAIATEPEKKSSSEYQAFAQAHISTMQLLDEADSAQRLTLYQNMVDNCLNCHKELCPGPVKRIQKLNKGL